MITCLLAAAILTFFPGFIHSVLGEVMVFSRLRKGHWVPNNGGNFLHHGHVRILWASWHVLTVLGWLVGWLVAAMLWTLATEPGGGMRSFLLQAIIVATFVSSAMVLYATKARHRGWVGLLGVEVLTYPGL